MKEGKLRGTPDSGYSKEYLEIKHEAETTWPAWKIAAYNETVAVSAHAKKLTAK